MGCFNVSCGISGISMYSDRAALVPLIPQRWGSWKDNIQGFQFHGANLVSNQGERGVFCPLTLPIFGKIDSYGRLEEIEKDENTEAIEKFFKMKIDDFAQIVAHGTERGKEAPVPNLAGMFIHREIYDHFTKFEYNEWGKASTRSVWDSNQITVEVLEVIGFQEQKQSAADKKKERYNRPFTCSRWPNVTIWSDGRWVEVAIGKKKPEGGVYDVEGLIKFLSKATKTTYPESEKQRLLKIQEHKLILDAAMKGLLEAQSFTKSIKETFKRAELRGDTKQLREVPRLMMINSHDAWIINLNGDGMSEGIESFIGIYEEPLVARKLDQLLIGFSILMSNMFACNKMFMPTFNGYQHGNIYAERELHQKTLEIISKDIKERDRQRKEDEDDE